MSVKRFLFLAFDVFAFSALALAPLEAAAQAKYPERPIRLVVPFAPGGVVDVIGRHWAARMRPLLGTVVVENQGGAGGTIGAADVARAQPDGYPLLLGNTSTQIINPMVMSGIRYDPVKAFVPVSVVATSAYLIVVSAAVPAKTLKEFIDYARANRGKISYGSAGAGTLSQLTGEMFKQATGLNDVVHIPYKGAGPGLADLVSGHIPMMTPGVTGPVLELHRAGKVRILAVASGARLKGAPDIPTAVESGMRDFLVELFTALLAPAGTAREIVERIAQATQKALADKEFQQTLVKSGFEVSPHTSPERALKFLDEEQRRLKPVIKALGFKPE
ncbi:MAG: tripartite tricarboxylate transporter substrate binding protein [Betaproteobacteria bacterium]|nr:tripartite tricarboxylate transporter substrate binding protein [Betaproteobacteria bacterium]